MSIPFQETRDDIPQLQSCGGLRRANVPLDSLNIAAPEMTEDERDEIAAAADLLGRLLAYGTQSRSLTTMGKRFWVMCYVLRPDLLEGQTLEDFAAQDGKTYQSIQHYIEEFKMTFGYGTDSKK